VRLAFLAGLMVAGMAHAATGALNLTPDRISVEAGTSQVVSVQFTDAAGRPAAGETAQFSNDACGTFPNGTFVMNTVTNADGAASLPFTASQPGGTVCAMLVSATCDRR
jgi:hypothetical protein